MWNARFLTPYGKITIVKSLQISRITHVLFSLPSPTNEMIDELDNLFKIFFFGAISPQNLGKLFERP